MRKARSFRSSIKGIMHIVQSIVSYFIKPNHEDICA